MLPFFPSEVPSFAIVGYPFPRGLSGLVEAILHLLYAIPSRDEHSRDDERVFLRFGFFKFSTGLPLQNLIPRFTRLLIGPVKVFRRAQDLAVQRQGLLVPGAFRQVFSGRGEALVRGGYPDFGRHVAVI